MSVMACNRTQCDNIMCDTYIDNVGYICNDCKKEFKKYIGTLRTPPKTDKDYIATLRYFSIHVPKQGTYKECTVDEFFSQYERK